jgi:hypothetical protein
MLINNEMKNCVCFLCVKQGGKYLTVGTAFFIGVSYRGARYNSHRYVVTARHNLDEASKYPKLYLRINTFDDGVEHVEIKRKWEIHRDKSVDMAVLPLDDLPPNCNTFTIPSSMFYDGHNWHQVNIGEDLLMIGLFTLRAGNRKNIPIARSGIIAAMPEEPIYDRQLNQSYRAYLAEVRSIGGLSGSPVFAVIKGGRTATGQPVIGGILYLIGLVRGHWTLEEQDTLKDSYNKHTKRTAVKKSVDELNTGIAAITPIDEIDAILEGEALVAERREKEKEQGSSLTLDSGLPKARPKSNKDEGITKQGFQDALKKASQKISSPDEEKDET